MVGVLVHAPNSATGRFDLAAVAEDDGLDVVRIDPRRGDVDGVIAGVSRPGAAFRSAGGLLARAVDRGAVVELVGANAAWFVDLPVEVTGRQWSLTDVAGARRDLASGPTFVKLADAKWRSLPAHRYRAVDALDAALASVHAPPSLQLLTTPGWLRIHSEYRAFTLGRDVVAHSPYRVEDDPWSPMLRTHRASFHDEAAAYVRDVLASLPVADVPPTGVFDVARSDHGGFVVLEVNHVWSSGLYGCDPRSVLRAVLAAAELSAGAAERWRWRPDPAALALRC